MSEQRRKISFWSWLITYVVLYGVYLLFVSTLTKPELVAGIIMAAIATVATGVFGTVGVVHFKPSPRALLQVWRVPYYAVIDTVWVLGALGRQLFTRHGADSLLRAVPFEVGGPDDGAAARRALAVTYTTLTPNFVVLGIAHKQALLLYHQVKQDPVPRMTINLGARP
jgi:hypothetical protein